MNKMKVKKEGSKWVESGIITEAQLSEILQGYKQKDSSYILIVLALIFTSIGILIFVFSDWAQVPQISRVILMLLFMFGLYVGGDYIHKNKSEIAGISMIILGYIFFGATMLLTLTIYGVSVDSAWPFVVWSIVGLAVYYFYQHDYLFFVGLMVTIIGQIVGILAFGSVSYLLFSVFIAGYFHFVFHHERTLFNYLFSIGLAVQIFLFTGQLFDEYYWVVLLFLLMYGLSVIIPKVALKQALLSISLLSIFVFRMVETFLLQDAYGEFKINAIFLIVTGIVWLLVLACKWILGKRDEIVDLILFLPVLFLPKAFIFVILIMIVFSIYWLITSIKYQLRDKFIFGIVSFFITTFTVYIQFGWESMNKSLFFIIGGLLLFGISYFFQKQKGSFDEVEGGDES